MKRIYLEHGEAYGNLGEEAMLINAARRLRKRIGEVEFIIPRAPDSPLPSIEDARFIPSPYPSFRRFMKTLVPSGRVRQKMHNWEYDPIALLAPYVNYITGGTNEWGNMVDEINSCDGVYFVGCANLNDFAGLSFVVPKYSLFCEAIRRNTPVVISSQTVGPCSTSWVQRLVRKMVEGASYFSTRDCGITRDLLEEAGVSPSSISFSGDEAFTLPAAPDNQINSYLRESGVGASESVSLIHFRATDYTQQTERYYDTLASALDRIDTQTKLCFVPMSYGDHSGDDKACGHEVRDRMQNPEKLNVLNSSTEVKVVRGVFERANWVLGLSYHTQVFALSAACPFGLLASGEYYHTKAKGVHNIVDRKMPFLSMSEATPRNVVGAMEDLEANRDAYEEYLRTVRNRILEVNDGPVKAMKSAVQ